MLRKDESDANRRFLLIAVLALTMVGCAGGAGIRWPQTDQEESDRTVLNTVPFFPQAAYQCGPAALAMVLAWSGVPISPDDLTAEVFTPSRKGSLQSALIGAGRRHDRIAFALSAPDALMVEVANGHPVIVLQNLGLSWYPVWHYAVVIGWDPVRGNLILHSGTTPRKPVAYQTFERTWARGGYWGLLVLPPSRLPAAAKEKEYLMAVGNLERMGKFQVAAEGYQSALRRWPDSLPATTGLGVCLYRTGDLQSAEAVFRDATLKFPDEGVPFNNLAMVLLEQGRKAEALDAVMLAIERGGPLKAHFESTLEKIRNH